MGKIFLEHPVESLFAKNPIKETIDFICDEIYNHKTLKPICKLLFLRNWCINLQQCTFIVTDRLCKPIDGVVQRVI